MSDNPRWWSGPCIAEFMNGDIKSIDVSHVLLDDNGQPVYLETKGGQRFNWQNILMIKQKE